MNSTELMGAGNTTASAGDSHWGDAAGPTVWYVGVVLHLAGGALGSLGLNLQRWRHQHGQSRAPSAEVFATRIWFIGFVLVAMDAVLTLLSYAFASLCKLASLGILALCLNTSVAPTCLKQNVHKWDKRGALIASVGAIIAITCANPKTPNYSLDQLTDYLGATKVIVSLCAANAILVGLLATVLALRWQSDALEAERRHLRLEYQRMHRRNSGSPTSLSGKQSSARDSPTSGSESLVTAPSDIDAAGSRPFRPDPVRPRTDGVALQLANRWESSWRTQKARFGGGVAWFHNGLMSCVCELLSVHLSYTVGVRHAPMPYGLIPEYEYINSGLASVTNVLAFYTHTHTHMHTILKKKQTFVKLPNLP